MNKLSSKYLQILARIKIKQALNVLPIFKSSNYTTFLIIGHPRTGTSLLHTCLNSHWNVLSLNEPFANAADSSSVFKKYSKIIKAVGFKYFYEYSDVEEKRNAFIELLKNGRIKIIKIERKNYLRSYVSRCIAEKTNEWSSTGTAIPTSIDKQIELSKEDCLKVFIEYKRYEKDTNELIKKYKVRVFELHYESLVEQPNEMLFAVQTYLGVSKQIPQSLLVRQNAESLRTLIKNYDALKESFKETKFEIFFEE